MFVINSKKPMLYFLLTWVIAAVILGFVNAIVRPIFVLLTFPLTLLTFGLFLLVINAFMLWLIGFLTPSFLVTGFLLALIGSILLTLVAPLLSQLILRSSR